MAASISRPACREHAARESWSVVASYHDAAISGASVILRSGVQALLQDAQRGKFDVVLAEALDKANIYVTLPNMQNRHVGDIGNFAKYLADLPRDIFLRVPGQR